MSTLVFVDLESSTQADGAQSPRVPMPLLEDPYEAIRHTYLDGMDTESEHFEDPIDTETPESSFAIAPPVPLSETTPTTVETEGFLTELGAQVGAVREEIFSQRYWFRSLEYEQERVTVTFEAIWRPVLPLEAWEGQMDAQRAALWHAISDVQGENRDLRL
ncbi:hypothetical protein Tco_1280711 [Tanacetum coccineum]